MGIRGGEGGAGCNGPGLCLGAMENDLSCSSPCVFLFIDSPDLLSHHSAEQTEKERPANYGREVTVCSDSLSYILINGLPGISFCTSVSSLWFVVRPLNLDIGYSH